MVLLETFEGPEAYFLELFNLLFFNGQTPALFGT